MDNLKTQRPSLSLRHDLNNRGCEVSSKMQVMNLQSQRLFLKTWRIKCPSTSRRRCHSPLCISVYVILSKQLCNWKWDFLISVQSKQLVLVITHHQQINPQRHKTGALMFPCQPAQPRRNTSFTPNTTKQQDGQKLLQLMFIHEGRETTVSLFATLLSLHPLLLQFSSQLCVCLNAAFD